MGIASLVDGLQGLRTWLCERPFSFKIPGHIMVLQSDMTVKFDLVWRVRCYRWVLLICLMIELDMRSGPARSHRHMQGISLK